MLQNSRFKIQVKRLGQIIITVILIAKMTLRPKKMLMLDNPERVMCVKMLPSIPVYFETSLRLVMMTCLR